MHGLPTENLTSLLSVDWLLDRVDGLCKVLTDATAVAVVASVMRTENQGEEIEEGEHLDGE